MPQLFLLLFASILFCNTAQAQQTKGFEQMKTNGTDFTYRIVNSTHNTFGYAIYNGSKMMIHQPTIPGMPGNDGFKTQQQASKTAELVITKMKKGEMPPTITAEELKKITGNK